VVQRVVEKTTCPETFSCGKMKERGALIAFTGSKVGKRVGGKETEEPARSGQQRLHCQMRPNMKEKQGGGDRSDNNRGGKDTRRWEAPFDPSLPGNGGRIHQVEKKR